jgi:hypothetical protein
MKKLLPFVLAAAFCTPAFAQKMGMSNNDAPEIKQSLSAGDAKMSLDYTSITWAQGKMMARLSDKDNGAKAREQFNKAGPGAPLAMFKTSVDCKCGDATLPAGEYQVYFTIGDDLSWSLNFKSGDKVMTTKLALANGEHDSKRLVMGLYAEEKGAAVHLAFGKQSGTLAIMPGGATPVPASGKKESK